MGFASKHLDAVLGIDIHIIKPPGTLPPLPIPHPFVGVIFDSYDYDIPFSPSQALMMGAMKAATQIGAVESAMKQMEKLKEDALGKIGMNPNKPSTVKVYGLPRTKAGTKGVGKPKHFPIGGRFVLSKFVTNECEAYMGSSTVTVDKEPFAYSFLPVLSCNDIGMPAPPRRGKPTDIGLFAPTSKIIPIPLGPPVMVGGSPVKSKSAIMRNLMGAGLNLLRRSRLGKGLSNKMHAAAKKMFGKGIKYNLASRLICAVTGHPVDIATGKVFTDFVDFELPGPIPFSWERVWYSTSSHEGPLGYGWHHKYDIALIYNHDNPDLIGLRLADGRGALFPYLKVGESFFHPQEKLRLSRDEQGFFAEDEERLIYRFTKEPLIHGEEHLLQRIVNTNGYAITFDYRPNGSLREIIDSVGRKILVDCDELGRITTIHLPHPDKAGETFSAMHYEYDAASDLVKAYDALNHPFTFRYEDHLLVQETNRNGFSFYFEYDGNPEHPRCLRTWGDRVPEWGESGIYDHKLIYFPNEKKTIVRNSLGHEITHFYNDMGLVYKTVDPYGHAFKKKWSPYGQLLAEINELGEATHYGYDDQGNQTAIIGPDGATTTMIYDGNLLAGAVDPLGGQWKWEYDAADMLIKRTDSLGLHTAYTYENGLLKNITDPAGGNISLEHDQQFNLRTFTTPDGESSHWEYDDLGRCIAVIDLKGNVQRRKFNLNGWVSQVNEPDGNVRELRFDAEGNVIRAKDKQHDVRFEYAGMGRLKARTEAGARVEFKYNTEEDLVGIVNEHGYAYRFELNANGEVITEAGFDGMTRRYIRDVMGRVRSVERASGIVTKYKYDGVNQVTKVEHSDGSTEEFTYRPDGELIFAKNRHITVQFERDGRGKVVKEMQGGFIIESKYDVLGMRTRLISALGTNLSFNRNNMGDVEKVSAKRGESTWEASFKRDNLGLEQERLLPGGVRSTWKRDRLGRPIEQKTVVAGGRLVRQRNYKWDVNDRLRQITDPKLGSWTFQHDELGNLTSAQYPDGNLEFRMPDAVGNLFKTRGCGDRRYGPAGQLLEANGTRYEYDLEGNLIKKNERNGAVWHYEWNASGMLRRVVRPDGDEVTFTYDALGRRISKCYQSKITRWIWDGHVPLHEWIEVKRKMTSDRKNLAPTRKTEDRMKIRRLENKLVTAPANAPLVLAPKQDEPYNLDLAPPTEITTWLFEPESFAPLAKLRDDQQFSIVTDHLGTPVGMYNQSGEKVWELDLSIYGEVYNLNGWREACPFRYPGQYEDVETGLHYNRFRYYDAEAGFYVSKDPIGLLGGIALYSYVGDPQGWVDELGLARCERKKTRGGYRLILKFKDGWTASQVRAAKKKIKMLNDAKNLRKTRPNRGSKSAAGTYRDSGKKIPDNSDIDHAIDLQLGGKDVLSNMWPLNSSVNRSLGSQINHLIKDLPEGTKITSISIGW